MWTAALSEYREENTDIYNIVMATIDLSGNREETDVEYLQARHYHHGVHRNGQGLVDWIDGLNDPSQVGEQDRLQTKLADAKLITPPAQVTVLILEKHCTDLLSLWKKIVGNDTVSQLLLPSILGSSAPFPRAARASLDRCEIGWRIRSRIALIFSPSPRGSLMR